MALVFVETPTTIYVDMCVLCICSVRGRTRKSTEVETSISEFHNVPAFDYRLGWLWGFSFVPWFGGKGCSSVCVSEILASKVSPFLTHLTPQHLVFRLGYLDLKREDRVGDIQLFVTTNRKQPKAQHLGWKKCHPEENSRAIKCHSCLAASGSWLRRQKFWLETGFQSLHTSLLCLLHILECSRRWLPEDSSLFDIGSSVWF